MFKNGTFFKEYALSLKEKIYKIYFIVDFIIWATKGGNIVDFPCKGTDFDSLTKMLDVKEIKETFYCR